MLGLPPFLLCELRVFVVPSLSRVTVAIAACAAGLGGCSSDIVPVSGRVTLDGQPLPSAIVTFQPVRDPSADPPTATGSVGVTNGEGRYELQLVDPNRRGALVGEHAVTISTAAAPAAEGAPAEGERVSESWRDSSQRFTVPAGGTSTADFDIVTPKTPLRPPTRKKA